MVTYGLRPKPGVVPFQVMNSAPPPVRPLPGLASESFREDRAIGLLMFRPRGLSPPRRFAPHQLHGLVASRCRSWGLQRFEFRKTSRVAPAGLRIVSPPHGAPSEECHSQTAGPCHQGHSLLDVLLVRRPLAFRGQVRFFESASPPESGPEPEGSSAFPRSRGMLKRLPTLPFPEAPARAGSEAPNLTPRRQLSARPRGVLPSTDQRPVKSGFIRSIH